MHKWAHLFGESSIWTKIVRAVRVLDQPVSYFQIFTVTQHFLLIRLKKKVEKKNFSFLMKNQNITLIFRFSKSDLDESSSFCGTFISLARLFVEVVVVLDCDCEEVNFLCDARNHFLKLLLRFAAAANVLFADSSCWSLVIELSSNVNLLNRYLIKLRGIWTSILCCCGWCWAEEPVTLELDTFDGVMSLTSNCARQNSLFKRWIIWMCWPLCSWMLSLVV